MAMLMLNNQRVTSTNKNTWFIWDRQIRSNPLYLTELSNRFIKGTSASQMPNSWLLDYQGLSGRSEIPGLED